MVKDFIHILIFSIFFQMHLWFFKMLRGKKIFIACYVKYIKARLGVNFDDSLYFAIYANNFQSELEWVLN